ILFLTFTFTLNPSYPKPASCLSRTAITSTDSTISQNQIINMSSTAPGQSVPQSEAECYNCGVRGHWMVACPEPTRQVPAGLQRASQQQQQDRHVRSEKTGSSHDRRGPVVTRYPVPPPPAQPIPGYGQPVPPIYPSGAPPGLPPPPSNPPPPPPGHGQGYPPPPSYPPAPFTGGYQGPPPQYGHGQYSGSVAPPPLPPQYGQQYGQPQYGASYPPPSNYYPGAAPPAPPPFAGNHYPQQYSAVPPPPPPPGSMPYAAPPPYSSQALPPPPDYQYPPAQPPSYVAPPPGLSYPVPPPGWNPPSFVPPPVHISTSKQAQNSHNNHRGKRNHGNKRNRDRNRDRNTNDNPSRGSESQRKQQQDHQQPQQHQRDKQQQDRKQNRPKNQQEQQQQQQQQEKDVPAGDQSQKQTKKKDVAKPAPKKEKEKKDEGEFDFGSEKDLKLVFPDTPEVHPADPVGIPLPFEYTEDPTIPPAYNATCIKSSYFNEYDLPEFIRSIRDSKSWPSMKEDPAFQKYPGMITRQFPPDQHGYPTYEKVDPPSPSAIIKMPPKYDVDRGVLEERLRQKELAAAAKTQHCSTPARDRSAPRAVSPAGLRGRHQDSPRDRLGWDSAGRDGRRSGKRAHDTESGRDNSRDAKRARRGGSRERSRGRAASPSRRRSLSPPRRRRTPSPRYDLDADPWAPQAGETIFPPNPRNDSGYHSGHSLDKGVRRSASRSSPDRSYGRLSSASDRGRSRTRSPSPLTAMEAGLLGMAGSDDDAVEEKKKKTAAKKAIKRPQNERTRSRNPSNLQNEGSESRILSPQSRRRSRSPLWSLHQGRRPTAEERARGRPLTREEEARERAYSPLSELERGLLGLADLFSSREVADENKPPKRKPERDEPLTRPVKAAKEAPAEQRRKTLANKDRNQRVQTEKAVEFKRKDRVERSSKEEPLAKARKLPEYSFKRKKEKPKKPTNRVGVSEVFTSRRW
ncbi:hypothetical protein QBC44DRAFT_400083, partial [Cladorrhinum sp. PSN332]